MRMFLSLSMFYEIKLCVYRECYVLDGFRTTLKK